LAASGRRPGCPSQHLARPASETLIWARTCQDLSARRLSIQQCQGNAPSIGRTSGERGRKYTLGRRDSKPSV